MDIDAARARVHIRDAKGNRDRFVPLPQATLQLLRRFWRAHRNPVLLFPNRAAGLKGAATATTPLNRGGVQTTLHKVVQACGLKKRSPLTAFEAQLCNSPDRGWCRSDRSTEIPWPSLDSDHDPLYPPD